MRYEFGHAAVGRQQLPDQLRSGDQHAAAGHRRIDLRPRARQPDTQQLRAARRRRLQPHPEDGAPLGVRHELHPLQPSGRREPALVQRSARRAASTITQQPSQGACAGNQAPTTCFRTTQQGYPEGLQRAGELQPAQRPRQLHPARHQHRQRPELARRPCSASCSRTSSSTSAYVGNRSRNLMILGDYNQARPNNAGENTLAPGAAPDPGLPVHPGGVRRRQGDYHALQVKVEKRYSRGLSTCSTRSRGRRPSDNALRPPRDRQWRQQPRQLSRHRRRVRHVGVQPAGQQHDHGRLGAAVRPGSPLGERPAPDRSRGSSAAGA